MTTKVTHYLALCWCKSRESTRTRAHAHTVCSTASQGREEADTHTAAAYTQGPKLRLRPVTQEGLGGAQNWTQMPQCTW